MSKKASKPSKKTGKKAGRDVTRFVAYAVGIKSGKPLESRTFKSPAMALSTASLWSTMRGRRSFVCEHRMHLSKKGEYSIIDSTELA